MNRITNSRSLLLTLSAALLVVAGCGGGADTATVHGSVTFEGQPVEYGIIDFTLANGNGFSAPIESGEYSVTKGATGEATVRFTAQPKPPEVSSREELEQMAGQKQPPVKPIPPDHPKQGTKVTISSGSNQLDFDL